jgi:two-component system, OmpR family, sensor kinase
MKLYTRIYFNLLLALGVTAAASVLVFSFGWRKEFARHFATKFARHASEVIGDFAARPGERDRVARRMSDELDIDITVRDTDGKLLMAAGPPLPELRADDPALADGANVIGDNKKWFTAAQIHDESGRVIGVVEASPMHRLRPPTLWRPVANFALVTVLLALLVAPLARRLSRPVEALTEGSRRLAEGDLSYRVPTRGWNRRHHRHRHRRDQLEELIRAWNEMAERVEGLVRGQKELLANVSHELRSPLARLRVALELLPPGDDKSEKRKSEMAADLGELDALIETLLTSARLEASGLPTHFGRVDVTRLLADLAERGARDPSLAGKTLEVEPVPPSAASLDADGALLLRALWNLVDNAGKYGASPITVAVERTDDALQFSVSDQGPGIPATERERVFDPFFRLSGDGAGKGDSQRRGFGLGLTLARRVAEVHGGEIAIADGRGGKGCKVTLTLPLRPV